MGIQTNITKRRSANASSITQWATNAAKNQNWEVAAERWALLRELYPRHASGWLQGVIAERELKQFAYSESLLQQAEAHFPDNPNVLLQWAELFLAQEKPDVALEKLQQLQQKFPDEMSGYARSVDVLGQLGNYQEAEAINQHVREQFPDRPRGWLQHAELAMLQENWPEALKRWEIMRERFPEHGAGFMRAATAAEKDNNFKLARKLRLAREYGNAWLASTLNDEISSTKQQLNPPQQRNLIQFAELVWTKARFNLKSEANKNYLRYLWWVIDPLMYMTVFYFVFGLLLHRGGEHFAVYLLTGLVPFQWFAKSVQLASGSIIGGSKLMQQIRISPIFFPLVIILQTASKQLLVFSMLFLFLMISGLYPTTTWLGIIPIIFTQLILIVVVSATVAMVIPFARDITNLIPTGLQFIMFTSAVFYSTEVVPEQWRTLFFLNPIATLLEQYRQVFIHQQWPDWQALGWLAFGSCVSLVILLSVYRRLADTYPRIVIE